MTIFVTQFQAQERYNICKLCDRWNSVDTVCQECWCITKIKVKFIAESCPLKKW